MRFAYVLSFFLLFLLASACKDENDATPESPLFGELWQATSTKINEAGTYTFTYKPVETLKAGFGIDAFRLERNGNFTRYTFGPADEGLTISGTWTSADNQLFKLKPADTKYKEFSLVIESVQDSVLQARYVF